MRIVRNWLLVAMGVLAVNASAWAEDKPDPKTSYLSARDAGPDFEIQGEYIGKIGDQTYGVQVIANGAGAFDAVIYPGGLPGAGWDAAKKEKTKVSGATKEGTTTLSGNGFDATIIPGTMIVKKGDASGELRKLHRESTTLGLRAPEGAMILFDGKSAEYWDPPKLDGILLGVGTRTKEKFESYTLHLEFRTPFMPFARGQGRGNSGMYLGDQYECQILDSFGLEGADNECGGIYSNARPSVNMCLPPLSWQTYDVDFTCAKFDMEGKVTSPARVTLKHNGVVVHDNVELKSTPGGGQNDQKPGALFLQDHGDPVRFQNIWLVPKK